MLRPGPHVQLPAPVHVPVPVVQLRGTGEDGMPVSEQLVIIPACADPWCPDFGRTGPGVAEHRHCGFCGLVVPGTALAYQEHAWNCQGSLQSR